ncbi:MAG: hypothetical protein JNL21_20820 [Myxococcales bacterium]|nr:hypothetical protein [Myxococcales bacterium]
MSRTGLVLSIGLATGCVNTPREAFDCSCQYLTDTDVPGEQRAAVCVDSGAAPEGAAAECVAGMGVGHVERCTCDKSERVCASERCLTP